MRLSKTPNGWPAARKSLMHWRKVAKSHSPTKVEQLGATFTPKSDLGSHADAEPQGPSSQGERPWKGLNGRQGRFRPRPPPMAPSRAPGPYEPDSLLPQLSACLVDVFARLSPPRPGSSQFRYPAPHHSSGAYGHAATGRHSPRKACKKTAVHSRPESGLWRGSRSTAQSKCLSDIGFLLAPHWICEALIKFK